MILTTLEVRWFEYGMPPVEVEHWFRSDCPGETLGLPEERSDLYLYLPELEALNIKLRQGNLELKWRKAELGTRQFGEASRAALRTGSWEGKIEKWLKWIDEDSVQQSIISSEMVKEKPWVAVKKLRRKRLYQGIRCELTQLGISNHSWWSIAFEMTQEDAQGLDSFENVVSWVSETYRGPKLSAAHSYAYPRWLLCCKTIVLL
ncbi:MAG: hypothetical protein AB4426_25835 [Xenococcaceae cyanobacterium]